MRLLTRERGDRKGTEFRELQHLTTKPMPPESNNFRPEMVPQQTLSVRAALRESAYEYLRILEEIADNPESAACDRIAAINVMLELGLGGDVSIDDVRADG